ncbi:MAG: MotA/TolQ/ExbB proton channel family protein [Verrucomicrobia bacterium]|nr:MotA/TolQ/ExbB proton channel family protein [Verrucomicrobiota bacterium]
MKRILICLFALWMAWMPPVSAESAVAPEPTPSESSVSEQTVSEQTSAVTDAIGTLSDPVADAASDQLRLDRILESGGVLVIVLAVMSVVAAALILYFFFTLNTSRIMPSSFLRDVEVMLEQGRFEEALALCERNRSPAARIVQSAVQYVERVGEPDADLLRQLVEGEGIRQAGRLQAQISYLMDIGVIAPMVGLLGTVMGMLTSFSAVALDIHKARPMELANGVSQALVTTAAGLMVAIPAMVFYSLFRGRLTKLTGSMELAATNVVTLLAHRKSEV